MTHKEYEFIIKLDGRKTPIKIVQYKDCTRVEFADGMPFFDSVDPGTVRISGRWIRFSTLAGWGDNPTQEVSWEISR